MAGEIEKGSVIHELFESAGRSIPDFDGSRIRIAERKMLWSKLAQAPASAGAGPELPPSATPEQVAEWQKPRTYEEWEEQIKHPQQMSDSQVLDQAAWEQANPQDALSELLRPKTPEATGVAHVQKPFVPAKRPARVVNVPNMVIEGNPPTSQSPIDPNYDPQQTGLDYTPGPGDPNYVGASKNIANLLKLANYLSKKI